MERHGAAGAAEILTSHFLTMTGAASREEAALSFFTAVKETQAGGLSAEHVGPLARGILLSAIESTRLLQSAFPVGLAAAIVEAVANGWTRARLEELLGLEDAHLVSEASLWKRLRIITNGIRLMGMEGMVAEEPRMRPKKLEQLDEVDGILAGAIESLEERIRKMSRNGCS